MSSASETSSACALELDAKNASSSSAQVGARRNDDDDDNDACFCRRPDAVMNNAPVRSIERALDVLDSKFRAYARFVSPGKPEVIKKLAILSSTYTDQAMYIDEVCLPYSNNSGPCIFHIIDENVRVVDAGFKFVGGSAKLYPPVRLSNLRFYTVGVESDQPLKDLYYVCSIDRRRNALAKAKYATDLLALVQQTLPLPDQGARINATQNENDTTSASSNDASVCAATEPSISNDLRAYAASVSQHMLAFADQVEADKKQLEAELAALKANETQLRSSIVLLTQTVNNQKQSMQTMMSKVDDARANRAAADKKVENLLSQVRRLIDADQPNENREQQLQSQADSAKSTVPEQVIKKSIFRVIKKPPAGELVRAYTTLRQMSKPIQIPNVFHGHFMHRIEACGPFELWVDGKPFTKCLTPLPYNAAHQMRYRLDDFDFPLYCSTSELTIKPASVAQCRSSYAQVTFEEYKPNSLKVHEDGCEYLWKYDGRVYSFNKGRLDASLPIIQST